MKEASDNVGKFHTYLNVEYEFITKNKFHNWTSMLAHIWHVFRKLGYFWHFLSAPVQAASGDFVFFVLKGYS